MNMLPRTATPLLPEPEPAPEPEPTQHACFSGMAACSGCNPCPSCREFVQSRVLPVAVVRSRMNEILFALHALMGALIERGVDLRQLGVDFRSVFPTLEEQGEAFFAGYVEGWKRMFDEMSSDPVLRQRIKVRDVGSADPAEPVPAPGPPPSPPTRAPETAALVDDFLPEGYEPLAAAQTVQMTPRAMPMTPTLPASPPPAPPPRPFDADEIALAGVPLGPTLSHETGGE